MGEAALAYDHDTALETSAHWFLDFALPVLEGPQADTARPEILATLRERLAEIEGAARSQGLHVRFQSVHRLTATAFECLARDWLNDPGDQLRTVMLGVLCARIVSASLTPREVDIERHRREAKSEMEEALSRFTRDAGRSGAVMDALQRGSR